MGMIRSVLFGKGNFASDRPYGQEKIARIDVWVQDRFIEGLQVSYAGTDTPAGAPGKPNTLHGSMQGEHLSQRFDDNEQIVAAAAFKGRRPNGAEEAITGLILQTTQRTLRFGYPNADDGAHGIALPETEAAANPDCFEIVGNIKGFYTAWNDGMPLRQIGFLFNDEVLRSSYPYNDELHLNVPYTIANTRAGQGQLRLVVVEKSGYAVLALHPHHGHAGQAARATEFYVETCPAAQEAVMLYTYLDAERREKLYANWDSASGQFVLTRYGTAFVVGRHCRASATATWTSLDQWYITGTKGERCMSVGANAQLGWVAPEDEPASAWIIAKMPH